MYTNLNLYMKKKSHCRKRSDLLLKLYILNRTEIFPTNFSTFIEPIDLQSIESVLIRVRITLTTVKDNNKCERSSDCQLSLLHFNPLPNANILDWSKLLAFADDKRNVTRKLKFVFERLENIVGEGENAGYQHFLLFPHCFQKASFFRVIKSRDCVVQGFTLSDFFQLHR